MSNTIGFMIGRFQPMHYGHLYLCSKALDSVQHLVILCGTQRVEERTPKNPFSFEERKQMIMHSIEEELGDNYANYVTVKRLEDNPSDELWVKSAMNHLHSFAQQRQIMNPNYTLFGHTKDESSYYLKLFKEVTSVELPNYENYHATDIRKRYFNNNNTQLYYEQLPYAVRDFLDNFKHSNDFKQLQLRAEPLAL